MMLLLGAQTFIPLPEVNMQFNSPLSIGQGFLPHELGDPELEVPAGLRLVVFSPHPDDETLAVGGLIQRVIETAEKVCVIFVTNGDAYVEGVKACFGHSRTTSGDFITYGIKRHDEAVRAISELGLQPEDGRFLGFPDQQGIDNLWKHYWSRLTPYTSPYTHFSSPATRRACKMLKYAGTDLDSEI